MTKRGMTLDVLRDKYRLATQRAALCTPPLDLLDALSISFIEPNGGEVEISEGHFFDPAKCAPGRYRVQLRGPSGFSFDGEATVIDPDAGPLGGGEMAPTIQTARFISALLHDGRNQLEHGGTQLDKAWARIEHLEGLTVQYLARIAELQRAGGDSTQKELVQMLALLVSTWAGLGAGPWSAERFKCAVQVLAVVMHSKNVQEAIRTDGGGDVLRLLLGGDQ